MKCLWDGAGVLDWGEGSYVGKGLWSWGFEGTAFVVA